MNNIHNFVNRQLCEYQSIFPSVASLLDHLLFTIGNGMFFSDSKGMIYDDAGILITDYPTMGPIAWDELIKECCVKEREYADKYAYGEPIDEAKLAAKCAAYKVINTNNSEFTEEFLYNNLCESRSALQASKYARTQFIRPYPLSENHSLIFQLNNNTPKWFTQIALNLCKAWVKFLNEELENNNVWVFKPVEKLDISDGTYNAESVSRVLDTIRAALGINATEDEEPAQAVTTDWADANNTTMHRDILVQLAEKFGKML